MPEVVETKSKFAQRIGITRQSVQRHAASLGFPLTADGKVRVEAAISWLADNVRIRAKAKPLAGFSSDDSASQSLNEARTELLQIQIRRNMLALSKERGEVIDYVEARRALEAFVRLHRDTCLRFAVRYGPQIAVEIGCDEGELIRILNMQMRQALEDSADTPVPFDSITNDRLL